MTAMDQTAVELAQALIRCRSVTPEDDGAIELLDATLAKAGARCHRLTFADTDTPKVENLYARLGEGPRISHSPATPTSCRPAMRASGAIPPSPLRLRGPGSTAGAPPT